jgi:hypothetical protein
LLSAKVETERVPNKACRHERGDRDTDDDKEGFGVAHGRSFPFKPLGREFMPKRAI